MSSGIRSVASPTHKEATQTPSVASYVTETSPSDVLLGRGVDLSRYQGNIDFRQLIQSRIHDYINAKRTRTCHNKNEIPYEIFNVIVSSRNGRFLRKVKTLDEREKLNIPSNVDASSVWVPVSKTVAIEKIKQALRDYDRNDRRMEYKKKLSVEIIPSSACPGNAISSEVNQKRKYLSKTAISNHQPSMSVTSNYSLETLVTQTLQQYQLQQQERQKILDASAVPIACSESSNTAPSVPPDEAINVKKQPSQLQTADPTSQFLNVNVYMELLQRQNGTDTFLPSIPVSIQPPFSTTTGSIRSDPVLSDRTLPNLSLTLSGQSQSLNYRDISSTLQPQPPEVPIILSPNTSRSTSDNRISQLLFLNDLQRTPATMLQQQRSAVPLLTDSNMMIQQYLMNDQTTSHNNSSALQQRQLISDRRNPFAQMDLPSSADNFSPEIARFMISSTSTVATGPANDPLPSPLISDVMFIPSTQTCVPDNTRPDSSNSASDESN